MPGMILLVFQDLTRVRRLETVRRDFVSNVSHELRTPLASLKALAETLQEGALEDPPAARRFLQRMETEIDNLTQMVHELLELSRIESGKVPLQLVPGCPVRSGNASRGAHAAAGRARRAADQRWNAQRILPQVRADPVRIEQVLVNLVHNAIKFTPPGGSNPRLGGGREKPGNFLGARHRRGHPAGSAAAHLRALLQGRPRALIGGDRAWSFDCPPPGRSTRRAHLGGEKAARQGSVFSFSLPVAH
jgi:two-component system, OmpR family, phosphate regulon sensor histidine kinase PhoR